MCGLVGIAGDLRHKDVSAFKQMLVADSFRGVHSTGVAGIGLNKALEPDLLKAPMPSWDFLELMKDVDTVINSRQHILMGHNRHATKGEINRRNAHPFFVEDQIVGCHNGTLIAHETKKFIKDFDKFGTDSEAALTSFVERGTRETLENIIGAWAFVWFDYSDGTLNFTRNSERPLFFAVEPEKRDKIVWASELGMLKWIMERNDLTTKDMKFFDVGEGQIVSFEAPDGLTKPFGKMKVGKYTPKKRPTVVRTRAWEPQTTHGTTGKTQKDNKPSGTPTTQQGRESVVDLAKYRQIDAIKNILQPANWSGSPSDWTHLDHKGEKIDTEAELSTYVRGKSCSYCGTSIKPTERFRAVTRDCLICEDCSENSSDISEMLYEAGVMV